MKTLILSLLFSCLWAALPGYSIANSGHCLKIAVKDSIGIITKDNRKFVLHKIVQNENVGLIAKHYGIPVSEIVRHNPQLNTADYKVKPGQVLHIPMQTASAAVQSPKAKKVYIVRNGETLYRIARRFDMTLSEIKKLNNLKEEELYEGQKLTVEVGNNAEEATAVAVSTDKASATDRMVISGSAKETVKEPVKEVINSKHKYHTVKEGESLYKIAAMYNVKVDSLKKWNSLKKDNHLDIEQKIIIGYGAAPVMIIPVSDKKMVTRRVSGKGGRVEMSSSNDFVALFRDVPPGTRITVINESTHKAVEVRVVGTIQEIDSNKKLIIQLSGSACEQIGTIGNQFPIVITYQKEQ